MEPAPTNFPSPPSPPPPNPTALPTTTTATQEPSLRLSPVDQASFPVYVRLLYIFPFPDASRRPRAERHLRARLRACVGRWPWLGGEVGVLRLDDTASSEVGVRCCDPAATAAVVVPGFGGDGGGGREERGILLVRELGRRDGWGWGWSYGEGAARRWFGEGGLLDKDVLSNRPRHPEVVVSVAGEGGEARRERRWPAFGLQVNWVEGGLVLCFAFHHQVVDGCGITRILEEFAGVGEGQREELEGGRGSAVFRPELPLSVEDRRPPEEYCFGYRKHVPLPDPEDPKKKGKNVTRILRFDARGLRELKGEVNAELRKRCPDRWVSTMDCLCAMIWIGLMRARWQRGRGTRKEGAGRALAPEEVTRFNIAVNARRRLQPPLPDIYMGNAFVVAVARASVEEIIAMSSSDEQHQLPTPPASPIHPFPTLTIQTVATAAFRIRQAVNSVDDAYIRRRFNFAASLCGPSPTSANCSEESGPTADLSPTDCGTALHRALDPARTGVDCSSWIDFPVVNFGIPGASDGGEDGGRPDWVRKTYSANPGAVNVLPRRGGTKGSDGNEWEVLVAAAEEDLDKMVEVMVGCGGFVGCV